MKKNYILVFILFYAAVNSFGQAIQTNYINYQGVARDAENQLMANESLTLGIALKLGGVGETPAYSENHVVTTDANGVFSLKIGNGDVINGDYANFPWGNLATYVTVSINGIEVGTTEISAVPYALSSGDAKQSADEVPYDNTASGLSANNTQDAIDALAAGGTIDTDNQALVLTGDLLTIQDGAGSIDLSGYIDDADADPTNEIQTISFDSGTNELSLTDGGVVTIPSGGTDADADPTNEIQTISFDATSNEISLTDGGTITIPSGGTDADADPTNEFQTLSFDAGTNELSLSDGNAITIPSGGTDADADPTNEIQNLNFDATTNELSLTDGNTVTIPSGGTDADADPTNEFQTLSFDAGTNELSLSDGNAITIPSGGTDADADPTNEIQTISFDAASNEISLTDGGTITIPSGGTDADADPTNEFQTLSFDAGTNELSLSDGNAITIPSGGTDADADPTNEIQNLNFDATTNELSLTDGNTVTIPSGGTDADADPTNEFQTLSFDAGTNELSLSDGNSVTIPTGGAGGTDDQNASEVPFDNTASGLIATDTQTAIDELATSGLVDTDNQNLSLSGTILEITDGASVDLSPIIPPSGTDDQNAAEVPFDNTASGLAATDTQTAIDELASSGLVDSDDQNAAEVPFDNATSTLTATNTQAAIEELAASGTVDTDNQALILTGDVLTIEDGAGSVDLSAYKDDTNATSQTGILLGDGTAVTGLEGTADGQVPKWDAATSTWEVGIDATGSGGSSLWSENGSDIHFESGNVGIGNSSPGVEPGAGKYLTVATGTSPADNAFSSIEIQGGQGSGNSPVGRLDFISNSGPGNSAIGRIESRTSGFAQFRGDLAFSTKDGPSFANSTLEERMTIKYDGKVGIGTTSPKTALDIAGGQWDLTNTSGDFRIGNDLQGLRIGVATGIGPGGGDVRLRAQGGTDRLFIGAGNEDVMTVTPGNVGVSGTVNVTGELNRPSTGAANMIPIAYGFINADGTIKSGSGNFSISIGGTGSYLININGGSYDSDNTIATATLAFTRGFITQFAAVGTVNFVTRNSNILREPIAFSFVIYSP